MAIDAVQQINQLVPTLQRIQAINQGGGLLKDENLPTDVKDKIAIILIRHLIIRNKHINGENDHLRRQIREREFEIIKAKKLEIENDKDKDNTITAAAGGSATIVFTAVLAPVGLWPLGLILGGLWSTRCVTKDIIKKSDDARIEIQTWEAVERLMILNELTLDEAKKIIGVL